MVAFVFAACSEGGTSVKCLTDRDCPDPQQCIGGACVLPGDPGIRLCSKDSDCRIDEFCDQGQCRLRMDEPPADGGDPQTGDALPDGGSDPGPSGDDGGPRTCTRDEDCSPTEFCDSGVCATRPPPDYSFLNFTVAIARGGTSGPATQCITGVRPVANQGGTLPPVTAVTGYTVQGTVKDDSGAPAPAARVSILNAPAECFPAPVTADGSGRYAFYLPGGNALPYRIQAATAAGPVAHSEVASLTGNITRDLSVGALIDWHGGPLEDANRNPVDGWTVQAYYRTGANAGKLAHAGALSGPPQPTGEFTIAVTDQLRYDLLGFGPAGSPYPPQLLWEDVCPPTAAGCGPLLSHTLRDGVNLMGRVTTPSGAGAPGCAIRMQNRDDSRLGSQSSSATDGNYQARVRPGAFDIVVLPSPAAFQEGAALYARPNLSLWEDTTLNVALSAGEKVVFAGKVLDAQGKGVSDANVRLLVNDTFTAPGGYTHCDTAPASTAADGSFQIQCNVVRP
jgi:hypothetical protein